MINGNALRYGDRDRPRGFQKPADTQGRMRADRRECLRDGGQTSLPWRPITMRD